MGKGGLAGKAHLEHLLPRSRVYCNCPRDFLWILQVICHQLGYPSAQRAIPGDLFNSGPYGQGRPDQTIWLDDLQCVGNETRLSACPNRGIGSNNCFHNEDIAVICNTGEKIMNR